VKLAERIWKFWAARSLMIGALSTTLDLCTGGLVLFLGGPTRAAAMAGTTLGSTFTYFANRHFAFKDHQEPVAKSGLKFFVMQAVLGIIHGQVVVWFRDGFGIPYVIAKMMADMLVVTGPQLLLMRHVIFPKKKASSPVPAAAADSPPPPPA
jgi:putative flippase GtrA